MGRGWGFSWWGRGGLSGGEPTGRGRGTVEPTACPRPVLKGVPVRIRGKYIIQGEIQHSKISERGINTHAQLDAHVASLANPHEVTADQVGKNQPQWNANQIYGRGVSPASPTVGQALVWDGLSWTPGSVSAQSATGAVKALLLPLSKFGDAFFTDATDSYTAVQQILWPGDPAVGNPSGIRAILFGDQGASYSLRLVNLANGASVAEASGSATVATATSLTLGSFPAGSALLEIQLKKTGGAGRFVFCAAMEFIFA